MDDSYKDYPRSIGELKSDKTKNAHDWNPRDALIAMLRLIDDGTVDPSGMVIAYRYTTPDTPARDYRYGYYVAGFGSLSAIGLLHATATDLAIEAGK